MLVSLDGQQTLIPPLSRLGLWQVLCSEGDRLYHVDWDKDPICRQQLGTPLEERQIDKEGLTFNSPGWLMHNAIRLG